MQKYFLIILLLINAILLQAFVVEAGSLRKFISGQEPNCQYDNWVSHLAEKVVSPGYNVYAPWDRQTTDFGGFHIPNATELNNWSLVIDAFLLQNWTAVDSLITVGGFPYQLVRFRDSDSSRLYYMLREIPNTVRDDNGTPETYDDEIGAFDWGWGLYIFNPSGDQRTIITVPHPCDDFIAPIISSEAFTMWNASFLMIAGAGREVAWTNQNPYTNSKSISDPTRVNNHPWYPAYTKFCNKIRNNTGNREFSVQLHSYDWSLHTNFASVQISAGYNKMCPNLPIRDLSRFRNDLINNGQYLMLPANTIGSNRDVSINDYYTVQYSVHPFTYSDGNISVPVNSYMDLPAYSQNMQMNYTLNGWNDNDVYEPFFHAEMSELPNCYAQNDINFKWFYGWNVATQSWDLNNLYQHAIEYYSIWLQNMNQTLSATLAMNDNLSPIAPTNLVAFNQSYNYVTLQWQKADDFDFDTYEILYSQSPIDTINFSVFNRNNDVNLASPYCEQTSVSGLTNAAQYYFKIRAKDKNGNYSDLSNQVTAITSPAYISNFRGVGKDDQVIVKWNVNAQQNNLGFKLYRSFEGGDFTLLDSYLTNASLGGGNTSYQWIDNDVHNDNAYTYKISSVSGNDVEFYHNVTAIGYPQDYFTLYVSKEDNTLVDSLTFSVNPNASSGNDNDYDVGKANAPASNYVYGAFWEQYWGNNGTYLQQEVFGDFDQLTEMKTWSIRVRSDQLNIPLIFRVDDSYSRYSEKLYLRDNTTGTMTDLQSGSYSFIVTDSNNKSFTLYWGNLQPAVTISNIPNRIYQGGSNLTFYWSSSNSFLVDHYNLSIQNDTDSLYVVDNLPNSLTSYSYNFPISIDMRNAKLILDAWSADGQLQRKISNYTFGIVPLNITIAPEPGTYMLSNVWTNTVLTIPGVFGAGAHGWTMNSTGDWQSNSQYNFGQGYWIQKPGVSEYTSNAPIQKDSLSFAIKPGWNIVPNPHICPYNIKDFKFRINGIVYTFSEMLDQKLISLCVYAYRNGQYVQTDVVNPYESFLIKYYGTAQMSSSIVFVPYNTGIDIQPMGPVWALKLNAVQDGSDTDALEIGSNALSTDGYDFKFDLPEPLSKPFSPGTKLYLIRAATDTTFLDLNLNSEYRSAFSTSQQQEKIWNFRLEAGNTNPVNFSVDASLFPDTYGASIVIGDLNYDIQHGTEFTFVPLSAGTFDGQLVIHNYFTGIDDEVMPALSALKVFPNPFNPTAQISFSTATKGDVNVDIYNIKGQHVKSLSRGQLGKGTHTLTWNGKDDNNTSVGTGVYLLKVKTSGKTKLMKMMLMK